MADNSLCSEQEAQARSLAWWTKTRQDPQALNDWLLDQYRGEATAANRILTLAENYTSQGSRERRLLTRIADQERKHARWVGELLSARQLPVPAEPDTAQERYWKKTLPSISDLASGAAVGAHAERMRLWRIQAIAADAQAPADVRAIFARILPEERFHERAFRSLAGEAALHAALDGHEQGMAVLGLIP
jgi:rubrerythrin